MSEAAAFMFHVQSVNLMDTNAIKLKVSNKSTDMLEIFGYVDITNDLGRSICETYFS